MVLLALPAQRVLLVLPAPEVQQGRRDLTVLVVHKAYRVPLAQRGRVVRQAPGVLPVPLALPAQRVLPVLPAPEVRQGRRDLTVLAVRKAYRGALALPVPLAQRVLLVLPAQRVPLVLPALAVP